MPRNPIFYKPMKSLPQKYQIWIEARKRFRLSHAHIQMARELGLNPKNFGKLANVREEPWKAPLPDFIAALYRKHFNKERPDEIRSLEQIVAAKQKKKAEQKARKQEAANCPPTDSGGSLTGK
jgi:hypothetical protein